MIEWFYWTRDTETTCKCVLMARFILQTNKGTQTEYPSRQAIAIVRLVGRITVDNSSRREFEEINYGTKTTPRYKKLASGCFQNHKHGINTGRLTHRWFVSAGGSSRRRMILLYHVPTPGGGGTPYNGLYGEAPPERGTFYRLQV